MAAAHHTPKEPNAEGARQAALDAHWQHYVAALGRAETSRDIKDGIAAGEAWRDWLTLFLPAEQGAMLSK